MNNQTHNTHESRLETQRRELSLMDLCADLISLRPDIKAIWLFGSRQHGTGSIRSDIDLLLEIDGPPLSLADVLKIRGIEPYLDCFVVEGGRAHSFLTESFIAAGTQAELLERLQAALIWRDQWCGDEKLNQQSILRDRSPAMSFAAAYPALEDPSEDRVDGVVITALREEFDALISAIDDDSDCEFAEDSARSDDSVIALIGTSGGLEPFRVLLEWVGAAGPAESAASTATLLYETKAPWIILCGIAAGLEDEVSLGDVLVPTDVIDCDVAKLVDGHFNRSPTSYPSHPMLERTAQARAATFMPSPAALALRPKFSKRDGPRADYDRGSRVVTGKKLAAGARVIADAAYANSLRLIDRKICGIEMEGAGVGAAAKRMWRGQLVVKAVSDFANSEKDDRWHPYASRVAAEYVIEIIRGQMN